MQLIIKHSHFFDIYNRQRKHSYFTHLNFINGHWMVIKSVRKNTKASHQEGPELWLPTILVQYLYTEQLKSPWKDKSPISRGFFIYFWFWLLLLILYLTKSVQIHAARSATNGKTISLIICDFRLKPFLFKPSHPSISG